MNSGTLCALILFSVLWPLFEPAGAPQSEVKPGLVVLKGRIECLDRSGKPLDSVFECSGPDVRYALKDKSGKLHPFSPADPGAAMFADARVRQRDLQVSAQIGAENRLEVVKVQSLHDGKVYDIYYYCELCNIKAYAPGLCPCCRNEMEFREVAQ